MGTTKHCYIQNIEALGLLVSEKKFFFSFSHCKSMETIYPRGVAKAVGLVVSEKKIFLVFPIVGLWRLSTPGAWPNLTPGT